MTSQGQSARSTGAILCIVVAMISVVTAENLPAAALDATSGVADEPVDEYGSKSSRFEDPRCDAERDAAPTLPLMECLFEYQSASQQDAALRERQTAARQAEIQAKGTLAITSVCSVVAFAVCSVVAGRAVVGPGRTPPRDEAALRLSQHRGAVAESGERPCGGREMETVTTAVALRESYGLTKKDGRRSCRRHTAHQARRPRLPEQSRRPAGCVSRPASAPSAKRPRPNCGPGPKLSSTRISDRTVKPTT